MAIWFGFVLLSAIGYIWAISTLQRRASGRISKRFSGSPKNFWKELPLLLGLNLVSEGPTEINHFALRQTKEGNLTQRQMLLSLALNSLPAIFMCLLAFVSLMKFHFAYLVVCGFLVWLWEKQFRTHTSFAFIFFGFGICGLSFMSALQQAPSLLTRTGDDLPLMMVLSSRDWTTVIAAVLVSMAANMLVRKWPLFLLVALQLGMIGIASQPVALFIFSGAWVGQIVMDWWDLRRSAYKKPYRLRAILASTSLLAALIWSLFFSGYAGSLFMPNELLTKLIFGLGFCIVIEALFCSLFFHFYFARSSQSSS